MQRTLIFCVTFLLLMTGCNVYACDQQCVNTGEWQLGVAVGLGVKTNPLQDGDNIPLVVLPDIAWYGDKAYFDNGELGYQFWDRDDAFEVFTAINKERAFFSFWHPANIFNGESALIAGADPSFEFDSEVPSISKNNIARRDWAADIGMRWHQRWQNTELRISLLSDISGVHNGQQFAIGYSYYWTHNDWRVAITPSLTWKSSNLIDYYYGIRSEDTLDLSLHYKGRSGWSPAIGVNAVYPLNQDWGVLLKASVQQLHTGMYDSPLVTEKSVKALFIGVTYQF